MSSPRDERPALDGAEQEFVERLADAYAPAPLTAADRAAFDDAIRARLERPWHRPLLLPAIGAAAAAVLVWWAFSLAIGPTPVPGEEGSAAVMAASWEDELFLSSDLSASADREEGGTLPDDYLAIASVFLDG
jgi:hypothetical protein